MQNVDTVYLVSCVRQKQSRMCQARDLYVSTWFVKARQYVESSGYPWFILSAEHGLVSPDLTLEPYERTLNAMKVAERAAWAKCVDQALAEIAPELSRAVLLAGERYREFLEPRLAARGVAVTVPMAGLRIGEQLSWLTKHAP